jgi:crotonobetainyl-CoA:carnitine CoA-transferase CaiB-like acyl-CoA transferase
MSGPLAGLRMVDVTENLAGPFCAMLLADMGVETVKIERPGIGDTTRGWGEPRESVSRAFTMVNRNKRSVVVDLKQPEGVEVVRRLAAQADILLENHRPGYMDRIGLGFDALHALNPRLIYAQISGFGQTGPYSDRGGLDLVAQAMSGLMSVTGEADGAPNKAGFPVTDLGTGMFMAYGILCALQARERSGAGQRVDTSLFETGVAYAVWQTAKYLDTGVPPGRMGSAHPLSAPYQAFRTLDGYIVIGAGSQGLFKRLCALLGCPDLAADPQFDSQPKRMDGYLELAHRLEEHTRQRTSDDLLAALAEAGIPAGPILDIGEMLDDPQAHARNMVIETEHPVFGPLRTIGNPVKLSATPWELRSIAPKLGQDTDAVLRDWGFSDEERASLRQRGAVV